MHDMEPVERLSYSVPEAARVLGVGTALLWRLVKRGEIPSVKLGSRRIIPVDQLRTWLSERSQTSTGQGCDNG